MGIAEGPKIDLAEVRRILEEPITPPKDAKAFFSGKRLNPVLECFRDSKVVDLDVMAHEGEFKDKTLIEYCTLLPEWRKFMQDFGEKTDELYRYFSQRIPGAVKKTFDVTQPYHPGPLLELYSAVTRLCNSISLSENTEKLKTPYRSYLQRTLLVTLFARLTYDFIAEGKKLPTVIFHEGKATNVTSFLQKRYDDIINHLNSCNTHVFPWGMPGWAEQGSIEGIIKTNKRFPQGLAAIEKKGDTAQDENELKDQVNEKYELISDLLPDVDFDDFTYAGEGYRIQFLNLRRRLNEDERSGYLFKCKIVLDPGYQGKFEQQIEHKGNLTGIKFDVDIGRYDLIASAENGDIQFSSALSFGLLMENKQKFLRFKNAVYGIILDRLMELEAEQPKSDPAPTVKTVAAEMKEEIKKIDALELREEPVDQPPQKQEESVAAAEEKKPKRKKSRISLRNRKGKRVLVVLESLLGPPTRCEETSHFIFKTRSGETYPISIHAGKDVGPGLLHKCLTMFGISREEFNEAY